MEVKMIQRGFKTFIIQYENEKELEEKAFKAGKKLFDAITEKTYTFREQYKVSKNGDVELWKNIESRLIKPLLKYKNDFEKFFKEFGVYSENPEFFFKVDVKFKYDRVKISYNDCYFYFKPIEFKIKGYARLSSLTDGVKIGNYFVETDEVLVVNDTTSENIFNISEELEVERLLGNIRIL